jgi:hypothetical protein
MKVNASNLTEQQDTTLIRAYEKLDEMDLEDGRIDQVLRLQTKISQELEKRGWTYDEDEGDWVHPL